VARAASSKHMDFLRKLDLTAAIRVERFDQLMEFKPDDEARMKRILDEGMQEVSRKVSEIIAKIDADDPKKAEEQIEVARKMLELEDKVRESTVAKVMDYHECKMEVWKGAAKMHREQVEQLAKTALVIYQEQMQKAMELDMAMHENSMKKRADSLAMDDKESRFKAEDMRRMTEEHAHRAEKALELKRKRDEQKDEKARKAIERKQKRNEAEHAKRLKMNEAAHDKALKEAAAQLKANEAAHDKAVKEAEVQAKRMEKEIEKLEKKRKIDEGERNQIMEEYKVINENYQKDLDLARTAMEKAVRDGGRCEMRHTPPKIQWGPPPQVLPGFVSWRLVS